MKARLPFHNHILAAIVAVFAWAVPVFADDAVLDKLFDALKSSDAASSERIEQEIWNEWSKSGSPAMDLLLERGREAMAAGDLPAAVEHLTALTDHAPDFAEGWNARATCYYQMGELGPAVQDIAHVLTLNPRHFGALSGLGMIFEELDQPEKALEVYKAALAIHPHMAGVLASVERLTAEAAGQDL